MISTFKLSWRACPSQLWVPVFLTAALLAVPISSTGKSIFVGLAVAFIVFTKAFHQDLAATLKQPWCQSTLILFMLACCGCFWSPAHLSDKLLVVEKYSKLLYLPVLAVGFRDPKTRRAGIYAFLVAMTLTCVVSFLQTADYLPRDEVAPANVFRNYIMTGHMMAFAAYLSALGCIRSEQYKTRILYAALGVLFTYQVLFISIGRTGYVIYTLLMVLLIIQHLPWRKALVALLLGCAVFGMTYYENPTMQTGVKQGIQDWQRYHRQGVQDSPIGHRLQFHAYADLLFHRHPWFGNGTGGFIYLFQEEKPVVSWQKKLLEPHSQYWLIAAEFGLVGLAAFLFFFVSLFVASFRLKSFRMVAMAVLLPFLIGNLSDSLLFYSGSGYFFLLFMALCLGESPFISRSTIRVDETLSCARSVDAEPS